MSGLNWWGYLPALRQHCVCSLKVDGGSGVVISVVMWYGDGFGNLDLMVW
jgi:hypothetical protein